MTSISVFCQNSVKCSVLPDLYARGPGSEGAGFLNSIPFPSAASHAFTPETRPSSRSLLGGGLPVHINEIHQLPDGRITFTIGYSYQ